MKSEESSLFTLRSSLTPVTYQTLMLFGIDLLTNAVDYGFHIYLGRALEAGDFAVVQTLNAALLIVLTTCGVLQPVVAKQVAAARAGGDGEARARGIFRLYLGQGAFLGLALGGAAWALRDVIGGWLNAPPALIGTGALIVALAVVRPVLFGMLQGRQQFLAFGATRAAFAFGRLLAAFILVGFLGGGAAGAVVAMVAGMLVSVGVGSFRIAHDILSGQRAGSSPWTVRLDSGQPVAPEWVREGWRLSAAALVAYAAYMSLLNVDLIAVNRTFAGDAAGSYAAAVIFRRILSLLPGAVLVVLYPRVVAVVAQGGVPDRQLGRAALAIVAPTILLAAIYFLAGEWLVGLMFGERYARAGALLGWMGLAMVGYGVAGIWLNLFLATRPWEYIALLAAVALLQWAWLLRGVGSLAEVTFVFGAAGWALALGGLLIYLGSLRPRLVSESG